jgi:hypothetical protein
MNLEISHKKSLLVLNANMRQRERKEEIKQTNVLLRWIRDHTLPEYHCLIVSWSIV